MLPIDFHRVLLLAGVPILGAIVIATIRYLARSIEPGTALNFQLTRLPFYGYCGIGVLLLITGLLDPKDEASIFNYGLIVIGWLIGLAVLILTPSSPKSPK